MKPLTRRAFLATAFAAPLAALYTWRVEPRWLEITRRDLPIVGLPTALDGKTLAHFSDTHIGPQVDDAYIAETFARVAALRPDLVVHTGDLITAHGPNFFEQARALLPRLPRGPLGNFAVLGNHDYGHNWSHPDLAARLADLYAATGFRVLRNETVDCHGLQITGLDDWWAGRFSPQQALARHTPDAPSLALVHNPDTCDLTGWENFRGWILAGHTHGGQCKPPFLPPPLLPVKNRRYTSGAFELSGGRQLYISRGVGHLMQVRFNVRPEVALLTLRRA